jgi:hypothetical protein
MWERRRLTTQIALPFYFFALVLGDFLSVLPARELIFSDIFCNFYHGNLLVAKKGS